MAPGSHAQPAKEPRPGSGRRSSQGLRRLLGSPITGTMAVLCGLLFSVSAVNSTSGELRPQRYVDLASMVSEENAEVQQLQAEVVALSEEVSALTREAGGDEVVPDRRRAAKARKAAGLTEVTGPGVTVVLSDAPTELIESSGRNPNDHLVHQQQIQAVVNAMWRGGAEAVVIQGQRVVTTTGIKCSGNAIHLQGAAYAQPYVIQAVGSQAGVLLELQDDPRVIAFRAAAADPTIGLGWDLASSPELVAPPYEGPTTASYAKVIRETD